ncbi:MAG: MFS transporter [Flavobacteriaceae bacterium]|nr:MFS transporter [Flavobacteriaceae bacterium]|tara:strand:+ start:633 stop:1943 length:1311 start_codon:yes stop_codon:yes gene_type:complete
MQTLKKGSKKLLNAWAFYDWANSVYSLVIASSVFPLYYQALFSSAGIEYISIFGGTIRSTPLITYTTAIAFIFISLLIPILSGIADFVGNKKVFMKFFCYLGAFSCMGLYFFNLENILTSLLFYFLALIGFWCSWIFYNSYLPDVAYPEQQDKLSAKGFSLGYIGSVLLLLFNLAMIMFPESFGLGDDGASKMKAMQISFISVGVWWLVFSQYTFYYLPKGNANSNKVTWHILFDGYRELKSVYLSLSENRVLKSYLYAFFVYSMAVQTVMLVATYFGEQEINWGSDNQKTIGLISSILIIQLVAVIGAQLTSKASSKFGNLPTLIVINGIWAVICVAAFFMTIPLQFYITAGFVGMVMGGIQALSRSTYSKFLPNTKDTASYFSFYDVSEKIGIVIGMLIYGFIDQFTGSMRNSIVFLMLFFIVGAILLARVPNK